MDKDFGELVFNSHLSHSGVILLRLEDATNTEKIEILDQILMNFSDKLKNNFCVYQNNRIRIRSKSK